MCPRGQGRPRGLYLWFFQEKLKGQNRKLAVKCKPAFHKGIFCHSRPSDDQNENTKVKKNC